MTKATPNMRHVYLTWPVALHRTVRSECVKRDLNLSQWLTEAARAHLLRDVAGEDARASDDGEST